ncbi:trypsin-like peptidase domain-containing protein [Streptomyces sp. NPDC007945]|uniref:trypsin-like peptidase domain-containing protein n=1 Tax=Streptomyces sp. NPDC007945 TaxID=3364797 RepID=UPI0036E46EE4
MGRGDLAEPVGLVRICDLAGRPRGTGFLADHEGTLVTSHEAVDGLARVVLHAPGERIRLAEADAITPFPEQGLALIRTDGLGVPPLPLATRAAVEPGTYVRIAAHGWREARVLGPAAVTYTATDRWHVLTDALELAIGTEGAEALRLGGPAAGGPVVDSATGTVLGVLGTALQGDPRAAGHAVPIRPDGPLGALVRRNSATIPAHGPDLNLAALLELTAPTALAPAEPAPWPAPVARPTALRTVTGFARGAAPSGGAPVLTVVGEPGCGRTTLLGAACAARTRGVAPAPTVRLRGADLREDDGSLADAVGRVLERAARIAAASGDAGDPVPADRAALLAREAGRPLLVVLDGPEEMPPSLAHRLAGWTAATERWLRAHGVRLALACRPEYAEQAAPLWSAAPAVLRLGDLTEDEATAVRQGYGIGDEDLAEADARHPLALRLLAEVRAALPGDVPGRPGRAEIFTAHLDLQCLRIAVRIAAGTSPRPGGRAVRRLAARVTGQVHEAARRCLGPGHGLLDRASFEELFPWRDGWAPAVLTEGLLVPAGPGYRFAHEELADWLQAAHLDLDTALDTLVPDPRETHPATDPATDPGERAGDDAGTGAGTWAGDDAGGGAGTEAAPRAGIEAGTRAGIEAGTRAGDDAGGGAGTEAASGARTGAASGARTGAGAEAGDGTSPRPGTEGGDDVGARVGGERAVVPRHRVGIVLQALLLVHREGGPAALAPRLDRLVGALAGCAEETPEEAVWWGRTLLARALDRVGDPRPYLPVLRRLADRVGEGARRADAFDGLGPDWWGRLAVGEDERLDLLRRTVTADPAGCLALVEELLVARTREVQPLLCRWFTDGRGLPGRPYVTVGTVAQELLHAHRGLAADDLCEALVATAHPLAEGLLTALVDDEPAALCRAVDRWAHDDGRPERRIAAALHGTLLAARRQDGQARELLRYAARALLDRAADRALHGAALGILVRDPDARGDHLARALADPRVPADALVGALPEHPGAVLDAFRDRLDQGRDPGGALRALAAVDAPALTRRIAGLVREYAHRHPEGAAHVAGYVDLRFEEGPTARAVLFPLVVGLVHGPSADVRRALAPVLAAPGTGASRHLRAELLDVLLDHETYATGSGDLAVADALLTATAEGAARRSLPRNRALLARTAALHARHPDGAAHRNRLLAALATDRPAFAALLAHTLPAPRTPGTSMPMRTDGRGHGSLRPA